MARIGQQQSLLSKCSPVFNLSTYKFNKKQLMPELFEQDLHPTFSTLHSSQQITKAKTVEFIFTLKIFFSTIKFRLQKIIEIQEPMSYILMDPKRTNGNIFSKTM
ncbi:hypothetical protein AVEN_133564-1 [Araneus ventricosus]|uniref:Uncharacterized protein n=1 Tax=Araneus ventricosus TaxID=182803 RepID=A0A4Y2I8C7_ARAVE|nr:hypothetical protein AVEN_133564-1 [Araneus ventricosus]